jgi:hypothetical protein
MEHPGAGGQLVNTWFRTDRDVCFNLIATAAEAVAEMEACPPSSNVFMP